MFVKALSNHGFLKQSTSEKTNSDLQKIDKRSRFSKRKCRIGLAGRKIKYGEGGWMLSAGNGVGEQRWRAWVLENELRSPKLGWMKENRQELRHRDSGNRWMEEEVEGSDLRYIFWYNIMLHICDYDDLVLILAAIEVLWISLICSQHTLTLQGWKLQW